MSAEMLSEVLDALEEFFEAERFAYNPEQARDEAGRWGAGGGRSAGTVKDAIDSKKSQAKAARDESDQLDTIARDDDALIAHHMKPHELAEYHATKSELDAARSQLDEVSSLDDAGMVAKFTTPADQERYARLGRDWDQQHAEVQALEKRRRELMDGAEPSKPGELLHVMQKQSRAVERFGTTTDNRAAIADKAEARKERRIGQLSSQVDKLEPRVEKLKSGLLDKALERHEAKQASLESKADAADADAERIQRAADRHARKKAKRSHSETFADSTSRWWERPLSRAEQRYVMSGSADGLDRILAQMARKADAQWEKAVAKLQAEVNGWIDGKTTPRQILLKIARAGMDLDDFETTILDGSLEARDFGIYQASKELRIAGAPTVNLPPDAPTSGRYRFDAQGKVAPADPYALGNFAALMKSRSFVVRAGYEQQALKAIAEALNNQFAQGIPGPDAIDRLDDVFKGLAAGHMISPGTPGHDYTKPAIQETTFRTMAASAFNGARQDMMERNDDFVLGFTISEVANGLDYSGDGTLRSHPLSQHLDGITVRLDDPRSRMLVPPNAYNDRAVQVPQTVLDEPIEWSTDAEIDAALEWKRRLSPNFT